MRGGGIGGLRSCATMRAAVETSVSGRAALVRRSRVRTLTVVCGSAAAVAVLWYAILAWPWISAMLRNPFDDAAFNQQTWLTVPEERGPMAQDVCGRIVKIGMSKEEVRFMLGPPDNSQQDDEQGNLDRYFLGQWGPMSIDGDQLLVHYDGARRVVSSEIEQD
jgi:hypothetical protein